MNDAPLRCMNRNKNPNFTSRIKVTMLLKASASLVEKYMTRSNPVMIWIPIRVPRRLPKFHHVWFLMVMVVHRVIGMLILLWVVRYFGWGNQPERLMAANYLMMYTLMFSFPLLVLIIRFLMDSSLPVYLFHLWLPKAHVEAPVLGSMILASILLKTGGYGLVKVGGLRIGLDWLVVLGFGMLDSAVVCLMLSHGVLSNSMFFMVGMLSNSSKTRLLFKQQGLLQLSPVVWFFLAFLLFMSSRVPPSIGLYWFRVLNDVIMLNFDLGLGVASTSGGSFSLKGRRVVDSKDLGGN
ncbi:NADH-ubiquinone oxidoreductase chain 4 [Trichinella zimbabwensis]|uniref:NADH-ubiquinone oxidoreductase chain 4 n=1 Tax=Trichinella zimbabwensis TaxID=268475 RepID=A0A0V1GTK0_9BILA|nr:NADH-ubiquinone oxidoreductase chain 4 [Trichinella zimbabwensis]